MQANVTVSLLIVVLALTLALALPSGLSGVQPQATPDFEYEVLPGLHPPAGNADPTLLGNNVEGVIAIARGLFEDE